MAAALGICLPPHLLHARFGRGARSRWPARFLRMAGQAAGLEVAITGAPLRRNVLFVANHLSWLDVVALGGATGAAFVSRDDVASWPLVGRLARMNHTVYVARTERRDVHRQAGDLRTALATGRPVALFPEGTTEGGDALLPFRPSLFAAIFPPLPELRVQPVAIDYGPAAREIAWTEETTGANMRRVLARRGRLPLRLHFLDPIDPHDLPDRKRIAEASRARIERALAAFAGERDPL
jgi:1-acyl-sn-glycerol-3-phosphate acyltransferase